MVFVDHNVTLRHLAKKSSKILLSVLVGSLTAVTLAINYSILMKLSYAKFEKMSTIARKTSLSVLTGGSTAVTLAINHSIFIK